MSTSSRKAAGRRGAGKKRAQRATSNVFAMFDQAQIQEFKEAFNMIDQNRDGFIDKEDLHDMLASLGKSSFVLIFMFAPILFKSLVIVSSIAISVNRKKSHRRIPGGNDERSPWSHKLYHVSYPVW